MRIELKEKIIKWLNGFPLEMERIKGMFRKEDAEFHLITMVGEKDTIKLWLEEYPQYCLDMLREELTEDEFVTGLKEISGLDDDELDEYKNDDEYLISDGFLEYMIIDSEYGGMLPETLFDAMKDKILVGDIVYAPYYETRMYYGINIACLDKKFNIVLKEEEGFRPMMRTWQKKLIEQNNASTDSALNHITDEYGDWEREHLLEMWE